MDKTLFGKIKKNIDERMSVHTDSRQSLTVDQTVWLKAWCAQASANNANTERCRCFANDCLTQFTEKFSKDKIDEKT